MLLLENVEKHTEVCGEKEFKIEIYDLNFPSKYTGWKLVEFHDGVKSDYHIKWHIQSWGQILSSFWSSLWEEGWILSLWNSGFRQLSQQAAPGGSSDLQTAPLTLLLHTLEAFLFVLLNTTSGVFE